MSNNTTPWLEKWIERHEIEQGGQGIVTEVYSKDGLVPRAVLKRIVPRWKDNPQAHQRLKNEAETLLKLNAAGAKVPKLYDSFLNYTDAEPFVLMEFIPGLRFDEWLLTKTPVKLAEAIAVTTAIASTIKLCHENNVGHRDLKPANLILKYSDINDIYVLDFGISFDSNQTMILTQQGEMFRNEFIVLPECQDMEGGHRDFRSDISALVGVLFSCLTGKPPIVLRDAQNLAPHQKHRQSLIASAPNSEIGEHLIWFFDKGFAFKIADRFQNYSEFQSELSRLDGSKEFEDLDPVQQSTFLDQALHTTNRTVQIGTLKTRYAIIANSVAVMFIAQLPSLNENGGKFLRGTVQIGTNEQAQNGDVLSPEVEIFWFSREHFDIQAVVCLAGIGVNMQVHFYATSFNSKVLYNNRLSIPHITVSASSWTKIAVLDENQNPNTAGDTIKIILTALKSKLGHQIRTLIPQINN